MGKPSLFLTAPDPKEEESGGADWGNVSSKSGVEVRVRRSERVGSGM